MEDEKNLTWSGDGGAMRAEFLKSSISVSIFLLLFLYIGLRIMIGPFFVFGLVLALIYLCLIILEIVFFIYIFINKLIFVDEISLDSDIINLKVKEKKIELPVNEIKIYQMFGQRWYLKLMLSGSYLKYGGKWYFVPVIPNLYPLGTALTKLPGYRDYYIWIIYIILIVAMIAFLIYLVWFVIPSIG